MYNSLQPTPYNLQPRIIITGANGFVGRHLIDEFRREEPDTQITAWDRNVDGLPSEVAGLVIDITDSSTYEENLKNSQPDWIIHLAAFSAVGESFEQAELVKKINVDATKELLQKVREVSPQTKVLAISSADIYGKGSDSPLPELDFSEASPNSPYAKSKLVMEKDIVEFFNDFVIRVRPFPHIGPGQRQGFVTADFASQIAAIEVGKQEPLMKVGNLDAERDFTDVRDVVRAYRLLLEKGEIGEVYHIASGRSVSIKNILDDLLKLTEVKIKVEQDPARTRPSDIPKLVGDASKIQKAIGWQPTIPLEKSLQDILDWWRANCL